MLHEFHSTRVNRMLTEEIEKSSNSFQKINQWFISSKEILKSGFRIWVKKSGFAFSLKKINVMMEVPC